FIDPDEYLHSSVMSMPIRLSMMRRVTSLMRYLPVRVTHALWKSSRVSRSKNLIHPLRQVAGRLEVGCLAGGFFRDRPALLPGAVQGVHHCRPVRFAVEQFRALTTGT